MSTEIEALLEIPKKTRKSRIRTDPEPQSEVKASDELPELNNDDQAPKKKMASKPRSSKNQEETQTAPESKKPSPPPKKAVKKVASDSESEEEPPKRSSKKTSKTKYVDSSDDEPVKKPAKRTPKKPASDSESEDEEPVKKPAKKTSNKTFTDKKIMLDSKAGGEYSFHLFDIDKLTFGPAIPRTTLGINFHLVAMLYNYGTDEIPDVRPLQIEGPEFNSYYGVAPVKVKEVKKGKEVEVLKGWSISCPVAPGNKDQDRFREIIHQVYVKFHLHLENTKEGEKIREVTGMADLQHDIDPTKISPLRTDPRFIYPIYYKRTGKKKTDPIAPDARPIITPKVTTGSRGTLFNDDSIPPNELPWDVVTSSDIDHIPMISFPDIYIGGEIPTARIRMQLKSTIVTSVRPRTNISQQTATILERQKTRGSSATQSELARQIEDLQASGLAKVPVIGKKKSSDEDDSDDGGDFSSSDEEDNKRKKTKRGTKIEPLDTKKGGKRKVTSSKAASSKPVKTKNKGANNDSDMEEYD